VFEKKKIVNCLRFQFAKGLFQQEKNRSWWNAHVVSSAKKKTDFEIKTLNPKPKLTKW